MLSAADLVLRPLPSFQCYTLKNWEWPGNKAKLVTLMIDFASPFLVSCVPTCACFFQCEPQAQMQLYEPCKKVYCMKHHSFYHICYPPLHTLLTPSHMQKGPTWCVIYLAASMLCSRIFCFHSFRADPPYAFRYSYSMTQDWICSGMVHASTFNYYQTVVHAKLFIMHGTKDSTHCIAHEQVLLEVCRITLCSWSCGSFSAQPWEQRAHPHTKIQSSHETTNTYMYEQ